MSRKIDNMLDKIEARQGLSRQGRDWLIAACDPFHDTDLQLGGYPDLMTSSTVVQLVKKSISVACPTTGNGAVPAGQNWDCHVALYPNLNLTDLFYQTNMTGLGVAATSTAISSFRVGGLSVNAGISGSRMLPGTGGATVNVTSSGLGAGEYLKGNMRLIGMGFEVINTTADIYRQGQVTCYRQPVFSSPMTAYAPVATTPAFVNQYRTDVCRLPPGTIDEAQMLYGSRSWAAAAGCYVVGRQSTLDNPSVAPYSTHNCWTAVDPASGGAATNFNVYSYDSFFKQQNSADIDSPFDISGAYFTGLSPQSTLTINVRWFLERVPGPSEPDLVVLATPSCPFDPLALELYTRCLNDMPPGVQLDENPLGEWFQSALGKVAQWAPKIGNALGTVIPGAALAGNIVSGMAKAGSSLIPVRSVPLPDSRSQLAHNMQRVTIPKQIKPPKNKNPQLKKINARVGKKQK